MAGRPKEILPIDEGTGSFDRRFCRQALPSVQRSYKNKTPPEAFRLVRRGVDDDDNIKLSISFVKENPPKSGTLPKIRKHCVYQRPGNIKKTLQYCLCRIMVKRRDG